MLNLAIAENCPFCHRCLLVLLEKKIEFTTIEIDLTRKAEVKHLLSPFTAASPCLWHDDQPVFESSVMNEYLDEVFPVPPLLPKTAELRAT
ncbi:MAG: glutathione S-transferase family protein, partial [Gammaproteobacteria bacterium]|nr:glutathione S-transferase family protein [Gammaproteobacteria bacterium]